jgi:hypothetical protein
MLVGAIDGATRVVGKSQGYLGLPIRDEVINCSVNGQNTPAMLTAWLPTPAELAWLNAGGPVLVRILGTTPPPMNVMVGVPPEMGTA